MTKSFTRNAAVLAMVAVFAFSCGGTIKLANPNFKEKVDWKKQQGIVLPIDIHGFGDGAQAVANSAALMLAILGSTLDENKIPRWISLQPVILLPPFNANLSHEMCWNVYHMADFHKEWDPTKDVHGGSEQPVVKLVRALPPAVSAGIGAAEKLIAEKFNKKGFKIAFKPRFLLGAHIDSDGVKTIAGKGMNTARVRAFLYDSNVNQYLSYAEWTTALPWTGTDADKGVVVAKMATLGPEILAMAIVPVAEQNK